ncbi:hypothetical protein GCM10011366_16220 [Ornithinimicrobium tianjinense]|uniref:Uncharacterized protein n=1 Tax=Ornithinimicrobium tianjinense TaxID=1195761 RepID=A0A917BKE6_9MICO|nr:hypothetical protein GCM10011366_16220 [Ornithinimicrobium tianjinense]
MTDTVLPFNAHPDPWWRDCAERALVDLAVSGATFTIDALRQPPYCVWEPQHPSSWGALTQAMLKAKYIEPVGFTTSSRASRHGSVVRLWRGTVHVRLQEVA